MPEAVPHFPAHCKFEGFDEELVFIPSDTPSQHPYSLGEVYPSGLVLAGKTRLSTNC